MSQVICNLFYNLKSSNHVHLSVHLSLFLKSKSTDIYYKLSDLMISMGRVKCPTFLGILYKGEQSLVNS